MCSTHTSYLGHPKPIFWPFWQSVYNKTTSDRIFLPKWKQVIFLAQVRLFHTTAFFVPVLHFDIDRISSFCCICRYLTNLRNRQSVSPILPVTDCFGEPCDPPKGGWSPSRLVLSLFSFVCSCLYMFSTIRLHFTLSLIKLIGTVLKDSLCRISTRLNYHNYEVRYQGD